MSVFASPDLVVLVRVCSTSHEARLESSCWPEMMPLAAGLAGDLEDDFAKGPLCFQSRWPLCCV